MVKRSFDIFFSALGLLLLGPLFLVISFVIILDDGYPVFFRQQRVGQFGKTFFILKFRTMKNNNNGPLITRSGDKRITKMGQILRRHKLDELPQLFNVLCGEMSFVGPRPEVIKYVKMLKEDQLKILNYKPGITSPASIKYRNEDVLLSESTSWEELYVSKIMPDKIKINLSYLDKANLLSDVNVIIKTIMRSDEDYILSSN
jgi:lipopolysaccharide/colanic/teichoic acid biosynthesis glycosyltransferase